MKDSQVINFIQDAKGAFTLHIRAAKTAKGNVVYKETALTLNLGEAYKRPDTVQTPRASYYLPLEIDGNDVRGLCVHAKSGELYVSAPASQIGTRKSRWLDADKKEISHDKAIELVGSKAKTYGTTKPAWFTAKASNLVGIKHGDTVGELLSL